MALVVEINDDLDARGQDQAQLIEHGQGALNRRAQEAPRTEAHIKEVGASWNCTVDIDAQTATAHFPTCSLRRSLISWASAATPGSARFPTLTSFALPFLPMGCFVTNRR